MYAFAPLTSTAGGSSTPGLVSTDTASITNQARYSIDIDEQIAIGLWLRVDSAREFSAQADPIRPEHLPNRPHRPDRLQLRLRDH